MQDDAAVRCKFDACLLKTDFYYTVRGFHCLQHACNSQQDKRLDNGWKVSWAVSLETVVPPLRFTNASYCEKKKHEKLQLGSWRFVPRSSFKLHLYTTDWQQQVEEVALPGRSEGMEGMKVWKALQSGLIIEETHICRLHMADDCPNQQDHPPPPNARWK